MPDFRHIVTHDFIARLRHDRRFSQRPFWTATKSQEANTEWLGNLAYLRKMGVHFTTGLMNGRKGRAGKFKLATRFERNRALSSRLYQSDDIAIIHDWFPAQLGLHTFQNGLDAARAFVRNGAVISDVERKFLVFCADAPRIFRLAAFGKIGCEFFNTGQCCFIGRVARHAYCP